MPKLAPLADVTNVNGVKFVFDPGKVSILYVIPMTIYDPTHQKPVEGPMKTHVWGITAAPNPINETPDGFLNRLNIMKNFVKLTGLAGPIWMKASAIPLLLSEWPGENNPEVKCYITMGGSSQEVWHIKEEVPTVRQRIDAIRAQPDAIAEV